MDHLCHTAPQDRDAACDAWLGVDEAAARHIQGGQGAGDDPDAVGLHQSGVAAVARAVGAVPVTADDVFIDLGAGLGRVALLTQALTGARVRGIEREPAYVNVARSAATRAALAAAFVVGDVREAALADGTVFYLYAPCTGPALAAVIARLHAVARDHAICVCALGVDLDAPWLRARPTADFWLTVYDSVLDGARPRAAGGDGPDPRWRALAYEGPASPGPGPSAGASTGAGGSAAGPVSSTDGEPP